MCDIKYINNNLIERLEELLEMAKAGEFSGMAYVLSMSENITASAWCGNTINVMATLGELRVLERDIIDLRVDTRIDPETGELRD